MNDSSQTPRPRRTLKLQRDTVRQLVPQTANHSAHHSHHSNTAQSTPSTTSTATDRNGHCTVPVPPHDERPTSEHCPPPDHRPPGR